MATCCRSISEFDETIFAGIGNRFAEIIYSTRQIESFNAHAIEAYAIGTLLYLALGVLMGQVFLRFGPGSTIPAAQAGRSARIAFLRRRVLRNEF
jgi:hypothetical protein